MLGHQSTWGKKKGTELSLAATTDQLRFDPISAVRGIAFHLVDERLGRAVAEETMQRTVERLTAKSFSPCIARDRWIMMTNAQRLEWLLAESQTLPLIGADDVVFLRSRRSR